MHQFSNLFKHELFELIENKINKPCKTEEIAYSKEYKIRFDGFIEKNDEKIIIEIEMRRPDPIYNLIKTIHWICNSIQNKNIIMIQLFDQNYYSIPKNKYKKDFTIFLARRCTLLSKKLSNFKYISLDINIERSAFKKNNSDVARKAAEKIYKKIIKIILYSK